MMIRIPNVGKKIISFVKHAAIIILVIVLCRAFSSFMLGIFLAIGGNITIIGISKIAFDPLITIAYLLVFYFLTNFFQPRFEAEILLFLVVLFLSFTMPFIQGSMFVVALFFLLRILKRI